MSTLNKLTLTDKTRPVAPSSPEVRVRSKMLDAIDTQIAAAEAQASGETFVRRGKRWVDDVATGTRVLKEVPLRFRPWWFTDENGTVFLEARYGNKRLEIKPKKTAIEVGDAAKLVPTLTLLRQAVEAGELDKVLMAAKEERYKHFRKAS